MIHRRSNIYPLFHIISQTISDEILAFITNETLLSVGKVDHTGLQHYSLVENPHLTHLVAERFFAEYHLVVYDADGPHVDLGRDHCLLIGDEAFGGKIPVCPHPLGRQLEVLVLGRLAQPEISDLDLPLMEEDVLRFEVVVDDLVGQLVQVANGAHHLPQDQLGLLLGDSLVFFEVVRKVRSLAVLHHRAEG